MQIVSTLQLRYQRKLWLSLFRHALSTSFLLSLIPWTFLGVNSFANNRTVKVLIWMLKNLPASDERWLIPRFISCFPIFAGCSKLFCETNWDDSFLLPLDDEFVCCWDVCCCSCCCCCWSGVFLQFRRNFVRKPRSGGYAGYYRPLIRTHPRLFSLLLYQIPAGDKKERAKDEETNWTKWKDKMI